MALDELERCGAGSWGEPCIRQGPRWLAELFVNPAWWVIALIAVGGALLVALIVVRYRQGAIDDVVKREMIRNGIYVGSITVATKALVELGSFSYAVDVAGGVVLGIGVAFGVVELLDRREAARGGS